MWVSLLWPFPRWSGWSRCTASSRVAGPISASADISPATALTSSDCGPVKKLEFRTLVNSRPLTGMSVQRNVVISFNMYVWDDDRFHSMLCFSYGIHMKELSSTVEMAARLI